MLPQEIIRKKRLGQELSSSDISTFFSGYLSGEVADYQMGAMLMAVMFSGMSPAEVVTLTTTMRDSGRILDWGKDSSLIVDKHSTGGVGDKTSLVLLPLCVLEGVQVPMIAGRGLGHTGGTLDKLESIPGMNVFLPIDQARTQLEQLGGFFMGQTEEIAPLDKRLYAMRDVTDCVESIPLITASILSKKLAEGIGCLVMDVKFGSGAFMREREQSLALAQSISRVGKQAGLRIRCVLSSMNQVLGTNAGNALEVLECLDLLQGSGPKTTMDLTLDLATEMVLLAKPNEEKTVLRQRLKQHLDSGRALEIFSKIIRAQGGDVSYLENPKKFPEAPIKLDVKAPKAGCVRQCDVRSLGLAVVELGGGRRRTSDKIDPRVGLTQVLSLGQNVEVGDPLAVIHARSSEEALRVTEIVQRSFVIGEACAIEPMVWQVI